jgi:type I restriction enzyme S subunit
MKSLYKKIGENIKLVDERNKGLKVKQLLGLSISKQFIPSVANIIGTDMENYKIIRKKQFACSTMQVRRDKKMPVALLQEVDEAIISQAYPVFEVKDENELLPEYLMMWFTRAEFDREACFHAVGGVRGSLEWEDFENLQLPIPSITKQREIVKEYNVIQNRIALNQQLIQRLEETAQAIYKQWFVAFEFPDENGEPYKSSGGEMVWNEELGKEIPLGWEVIPFAKYIFFQEGPGLREWQWTDSGIKVINVKNILNDGTVDTNNTSRFISIKEYKSTYSHFLIDEGDIVIASSGNTYGKAGKVLSDDLPLLMNTSVIRFHSYDKKLMPESFVQTYLFSFQMKEQVEASITGSAQPNFGPSHIRLMKILYSKEVLLFHFDKTVKPILDKKDLLNKMNRTLEKLKNLLLSKLTTIEN